MTVEQYRELPEREDVIQQLHLFGGELAVAEILEEA